MGLPLAGAESPLAARLLAASILSCCFLLTGAQSGTVTITITADLQMPIVGQNITLTPSTVPAMTSNCIWYRGPVGDNNIILYYFFYPHPGQTNGSLYTGRESVKSGCSLHITNLNINDSGTYTVRMQGAGLDVQGSLAINVSEVLSKPTLSVFPSPFPREAIDPLQLTCGTTATDANINWFLNGSLVENSSRTQLFDHNRILAIRPVLRGDAGNYQCQVFNLAYNETSDALYIPVIYGPDAAVITPNASTYYEHSDIRLTCAADAFPEPEYTWLFNGLKIGSGEEFIFPDVRKAQSGNYTCQATNILSHKMAGANLEIQVVGGIYNVTILGPSTVKEHNLVTLTCVSIGPNVSYHWLKGGQLIEAGGHITLTNNSQILTLNTTNRDDAGAYTCFGNNSISFSYSEPHTLEVFYGPDEPIIEPSEQVYLEGSTLNLSCSANSYPNPKYSWYFDGDLIPRENTSRLIQSLSLGDAGNYTCKVTNDMTGLDNYASLVIRVLEPVTNVVITSTPIKVLENNVTVLTCNSDGTEVSYFWLKGNQILEVGDRISLRENNQVVTFNTTLRSDSDVYTCYANNTFSHSMGNYTLNVLYGPDEPVISPNTSYYATGTSLSLFCQADSNPPANYSWSVNNQIYEVANLHISDLSTKNTGNYTCMASNVETGLNRSQVLEIWVVEPVTNVVITSTPIKVLENSVTVLTCNSNGTDVSYFWLKGNQVLEAGDHISLSKNNQVVTFNTILRSDSDVYTCYANNTFSQSKSNYTLNVLYGPDEPVISPNISYYATGSNLSLSCYADSNPPANYTWSVNNQIYEHSNLTILNVSSNNNGNYTCKASNVETGLNSSQVLEIWVMEILSKPTLWPPSYMPLEKEDVLLECNTSSSPNVNVAWYKDGNLLLQAANVVFSGNNRNLTILGFTKADDGNYACEASNAISKERSDPSVITMAYGPDNVNINKSGDISVALGSPLVLLCSADSNPAAQFRWFFNNSAMKEVEATFRVASVTWEDGGNYTCQAHNNRTNLTVSASVTVKVSSETSPGPNGLSPGAIAGIVIGCLAAVVLIAGLVYYLCTKTSLGRTERHASNGNIPSAPGHNQGATDTKPRTGEEDIQYSTLAFNANSPPQPAPGAGQPLDSNIIYSEIKKK